MKRLNVIPSYGREYKSKAEVVADLEAEKDFTVADMSSRWDGMQCNRTDLRNEGVTDLQVRYGKNLARVCVIKL